MSEQFNQICWGAPPLDNGISLLGILKNQVGSDSIQRSNLNLRCKWHDHCNFVFWEIFHGFLLSAEFFKIIFFKKIPFIRTNNSLDSDQA